MTFSMLTMFEKRDTSCVEAKGNDEHGYISVIHKGKKWRAHRLIMFLKDKKKFKWYAYVCHKCNNKKCINEEHLYYGTALDNSKDRTEKFEHIYEHPGHRYGDLKWMKPRKQKTAA